MAGAPRSPTLHGPGPTNLPFALGSREEEQGHWVRQGQEMCRAKEEGGKALPWAQGFGFYLWVSSNFIITQKGIQVFGDGNIPVPQAQVRVGASPAAGTSWAATRARRAAPNWVCLHG